MNASAGSSPAHAPPVCTLPTRIWVGNFFDVHASCWLTAKMNSTVKKPSFFFQCGRSITRKTSSAKQSHSVMRRSTFFSALACALQPMKDKNKETTINMVFLFFLRRGRPSLSQGNMMARDTVARAPQCLSTCVMGRHNNPKESCAWIYQGKRKKQQSK